jgi:carboxymethylenebutenolidase
MGPALLILHEVGGLNETMRAMARRLAAEGYVVLLPDLYDGAGGPAGLVRLVGGVALWPLRNRPLADLRAIVAALRLRPDVAPDRIGVVGYSLGAAYALQLACVEPAVRAAVAYCGQLPRPLAALRGACPIMASYAERDPTTAGLAPKLARALARQGVPHDVRTYPGTRHAFYDPYGPTYDRAAADDAWRRTLAFLRRHLPAGPH